jgi:teichuronic acid biosynthesis glycosyltransferase TuaH
LKPDGLDIIVFPFHDWRKCEQQGLRRRDTSVVLLLASHPAVRRVLVVDRPLALPHLVFEAMRGRSRRVRQGELVRYDALSSLTQVGEKLYVLDFIVPDILHSLLLGRGWWPHVLGQEAVARRTREAAGRLEMANPVLWLCTPISAPLIGRLGESLVVFDAIDNWLRHVEMGPYREASARGYEAIRQRADVIFCVSESLVESLAGGRADPSWVPNGVDLGLFTPTGPRAADVLEIPGPRVGYAGVFERRVDLELVAAVASALPSLSFVFVGPYDRRLVAPLAKLPNVHFLGRRPFEEVPAYLRAMDLCVMPHRVDAFTDSMNPLKLYEYLACGLPVVSTPVAGTESFRGLVDIAGTPEEFVAAIAEALQRSSPEEVAARRRAVEAHSWQSRVNGMVDTVLQAQQRKEAGREPATAIYEGSRS